jgi:hypothetical protein
MPLDSAVEKGFWPIADDAAVGPAIFDGPITWPLLTRISVLDN